MMVGRFLYTGKVRYDGGVFWWKPDHFIWLSDMNDFLGSTTLDEDTISLLLKSKARERALWTAFKNKGSSVSMSIPHDILTRKGVSVIKYYTRSTIPEYYLR